VQVIPNSVESDWYVEKPLDDGERKPYLLTVSGEASSKNLSGLLKGLAEMRRMGVGRDLRLRVVGVKPEFQDRFARQADSLGMGSVVKFEPFLDGSDLRRLYREAWAFVLPSFFEGFGIPVLEAMASGTPVVCSDTTSLPEVAGGAAWLFDPRRVRDMAEALAGAVAGGVERSVRARAGLARAHKFHFGEVRKQIQEFWISIE
jgi:glycosyltransferase involved in cell wall biosynthesis